MSELRREAPFADMPGHDLAVLARSARSRDFERGDRLFEAGAPSTEISVILAGLVRLSRAGGRADGTTTGILGRGDLLSVAALRGGLAHDNHAEALTTGRLATIPAETLLATGARSPCVLVGMVEGLGMRLDGIYADLLHCADPDVEQRVMHVLRILARPWTNPLASRGGTMRRLRSRPTHEDLARLAGCNRASVTRALRQLETRGLVQRRRGHVVGVAIPAAGAEPASIPNG